MPPGCSMYELQCNLEARFHYFKYEHLKPPPFNFVLGAGSRGKLLVLDIKGMGVETSWWSQDFLVRDEDDGQPRGVLGKIL